MIKALIIGFFLLLSLQSVADNQADSILNYIQHKKDHVVDTGVVDFLNAYSQSHDLEQLAQFSEEITSLYRQREEYLNEYNARQRTVVLFKNARNFDDAIALTLLNIDLINSYLPEMTSVQAYANLGVIFSEADMLEKADSVFFIGESQMSDLTSNAHAMLIYIGKGNLLNRQGRHRDAIEQLRIALHLCDASNHNFIGAITTNIAVNFQSIGKLDSSILYLQKAENAYEKAVNERGRAISLYTKANTLFELGRYSEALEHHQRAYELFKSLHITQGEVAVLNELGNAKKNLGQIQSALETYRKALSLSRKIDHARFEGIIQSSVGTLYYNLNNIDSAITYYNDALEISISKGYLDQEYSTQLKLALCHWKKGEGAKANDLLTNVLAQVEERGEPSELIQTLITSAELSSEVDPKASLLLLTSALKLARQHHLVKDEIASMELMSLLHANQGEYDSAYTYLKPIHDLRQSIYAEDLAEETAFLNSRISSLEKERKLHAQEQLISDLEIEQEKLNSRITLFVSVSIIILIILGWLFYSAKANERLKQKKLSDKKIFDSLEHERRRFAKDLHDGIGQKLLLIKSQLKKADGYQKGNIVDETLEEMRRISHNLYPATLERLGLEKAIEELLNELETSHGLVTHLEVDSSNFESLPLDTQTMIYRIIQEGTNNSIKYAKAKSIRVDMSMKENSVEVNIQDNGVGFEVGDNSDGIGLQSMKTRIESLGGRLKIKSTLDSGTTLTLAFTHGSSQENTSSG